MEISEPDPVSLLGVSWEIVMYDEKNFSADAIAAFGLAIPGLTGETSLHMQMGCLADTIRMRPDLADDILAFVEASVSRPDSVSEIENAVAISFISLSEASQFGLLEKIPPAVKSILVVQERKWSSLT